MPAWSMFRLSRVSLSGTLALLLGAFLIRAASAEVPEPPRSTDGTATISLFASEPDIVTPIGCTVDSRGRLIVIESQTHFRPKTYQGPPTDRIRIVEDTKGTGKADRFTTLYEGGKYFMNIVADGDGSVVVSSRNEVFRLISDGDGPARKVTLATLETEANYPHNGLHGLTIDHEGNVYMGLGENLGGPYTLVGTDGKKFSDDKGSGAVFRVDAKGAGLTRISHGFWNPFGLGVDREGNIWTVDNDPDGRPPCRLIHIVPGGDFGFEFRFGRTGMHPLQCWDGELPGTLGMVAGVGEAPCAVRDRDGRLLVTSWRDHQVESYTPVARGAGYTSTMEKVLTGPESFRPVGLAQGHDGVMFVTDWGSGSYPVNGKGRIWKVTFASAAPIQPAPVPAMARAASLRQSKDVAELIEAMDDADASTAQAAEYGLSRLDECEKLDWSQLKTPRQRIWFLAALVERGANSQTYMSLALKDSDDRVRQMAVRAIAEQNLTGSKEALEGMLATEVMSPRLLGMTVAALGLLNGDKNAKIDGNKINGVLLSRMKAKEATDQTRATALHMLQHNHPKIPVDELGALLKAPTTALQLEAVRYLSADSDPARFPLMAQAAQDGNVDTGVRAEAIVGLADDAATQTPLLLKLTDDANAAIRDEALRSLRPVTAQLTPAQQEQLASVARQHPEEADLVQRALGKVNTNRPAETDMAGWQKILDSGTGNPEAGRRIFFHPSGPGCFRCHTIEGRGHTIGPDLSMIGHSQTRDHILESILDPSREIAPLYTFWSIKTKSGDQIDGLLLRRDGQENEVYVDAAGKETKIDEKQIVDRRMRKESLMPAGLVQGLTDQELRDVVALLMQKR